MNLCLIVESLDPHVDRQRFREARSGRGVVVLSTVGLHRDRSGDDNTEAAGQRVKRDDGVGSRRWERPAGSVARRPQHQGGTPQDAARGLLGKLLKPNLG